MNALPLKPDLFPKSILENAASGTRIHSIASDKLSEIVDKSSVEGNHSQLH